VKSKLAIDFDWSDIGEGQNFTVARGIANQTCSGFNLEMIK
jgi:hypothetical protein